MVFWNFVCTYNVHIYIYLPSSQVNIRTIHNVNIANVELLGILLKCWVK